MKLSKNSIIDFEKAKKRGDNVRFLNAWSTENSGLDSEKNCSRRRVGGGYQKHWRGSAFPQD